MRISDWSSDVCSSDLRLTIARAGVGNDTESSVEWSRATEMAGGLSEDIQGLFLLIARAALDQAPCPSDAEVARVCGSRSTGRSEEHTSELQSLMRISYAVFCLKKKK